MLGVKVKVEVEVLVLARKKVVRRERRGRVVLRCILFLFG